MWQTQRLAPWVTNNTLEDAAIPDTISYAAGATPPGEDVDVADTVSYAADATPPGEDADVADAVSYAAGATPPGEDADVADTATCAAGATPPGEDADVADGVCHICILTKKNPCEERSDEASESTHNGLSNLKIRVDAIAPSPA